MSNRTSENDHPEEDDPTRWGASDASHAASNGSNKDRLDSAPRNGGAAEGNGDRTLSEDLLLELEEEEIRYLRTEIYGWEDAEPLIQRLTALDRYRA